MTGVLVLADGRQIAVRDGLTLGRVAACDVPLQDTKASRRHAMLHVAGSVVEVEDLDSSNGTMLNGRAVKRRVLREGDVIQIGTTRITYRVGSAAPAVPVDAPPPEAAPPPAAPQPAMETLEFLDEVVQVRAQPRAAPPAATRGQAPAAARGQRERGILQYHRRSGGGPLADDLAQMSLGRRLLYGLVAAGFAVALFYLALRLAG